MLLFCSIGCIDEIVAIHAFLSSHANMIRKTKIVKSKKHLEYLARNYPCLKCRTTYGVQACHIRKTDSLGNVGWGTKGGDAFVVPLCYLCHQKQHSMNETLFYCQLNINPIRVAFDIALKSPCKKIKQLAKEGHYDEPIKYYDNLQASAKSTLESENL
jgi:hypothetical protein